MILTVGERAKNFNFAVKVLGKDGNLYGIPNGIPLGSSANYIEPGKEWRHIPSNWTPQSDMYEMIFLMEIVWYITYHDTGDQEYYAFASFKNVNNILVPITSTNSKSKAKKLFQKFHNNLDVLGFPVKQQIENNKIKSNLYEKYPRDLPNISTDGPTEKKPKYDILDVNAIGSTVTTISPDYGNIKQKPTDNKEIIKTKPREAKKSTPSFMPQDEHPFNTELVNGYVKLLKTNELSNKGVIDILSRIRPEVLKIYRNKQVDKEITLSIKKIISVTFKIMEEIDDNEINKNIIDILDLLVKANEDIKKSVKNKFYKKLIEKYEDGYFTKDLISILYDMGYFKNIQKEILEVIDNRQNLLLTYLRDKIEYNKLKNKMNFAQQLLLKVDDLDEDEDKQLIIEIKSIINQLENS